MRVVVVCQEPETSGDPDSVVSALGEMGCRILLSHFDLGALHYDALKEFRPSIVVIDAGDDLVRAGRCLRKKAQIAQLADVPALLALTVPRLSALDFSAGFQDFVLLPVVPAELYARLRQLDWRTAVFGSDEVIKLGELVIDLAGYSVRLGGRRIDFPHQEFELLRFLAQNRGRVFSREQLLARVWGYEYAGSTRTVDIHVRRVRAKLGAVGNLIETVRNVGYKMREEYS